MQNETARQFWDACLDHICNNSAETPIPNPAVEFTRRVKCGEFDRLTDEEYALLLQDVNALAYYWHDNSQRPAGALLLDLLQATDIDSDERGLICDLLSEYSGQTEYAVPQDEPGAGVWGLQAGLSKSSELRWSPKRLYRELCEHVLGQDDAKRAAATLTFNHLEGRRSTAVFCGPSGCGKSETWRRLSQLFPGLIRIFDASRLSADGWKGSVHIRDFFEGLSPEDLRNNGLIVVLDEADKMCCETVMGSSGTNYSALVQNGLLKMLDGDELSFGEEDKKRAFKVDCSRVSVVLLGAFEGLMKSKTQKSGGLGFGAAPRVEQDYGNTDISYDDLISAGMRREIAGRINRIVSLRPLSADDYMPILTGPVLRDLQTAAKRRIVLDQPSAAYLSEHAASSGLGVRWMRSKLVNAMDDLIFDDPDLEEYDLTFQPEN